MLVGEGVVEGEGVVVAQLAVAQHLGYVVLVVVYVGSVSMPPPLIICILPDTIHQHPHALLIQRAPLIKINNIELTRPPLSHPRYFKEKPLSIPISIDIFLHH